MLDTNSIQSLDLTSDVDMAKAKINQFVNADKLADDVILGKKGSAIAAYFIVSQAAHLSAESVNL